MMTHQLKQHKGGCVGWDVLQVLLIVNRDFHRLCRRQQITVAGYQQQGFGKYL
jgi:hypothetical protein